MDEQNTAQDNDPILIWDKVDEIALALTVAMVDLSNRTIPSAPDMHAAYAAAEMFLKVRKEYKVHGQETVQRAATIGLHIAR